jgi:WD40 repeat protein
LEAPFPDSTIRFWDMTARKQLPAVNPLGEGCAWSLAISPDGKLLAAVGGRRLVLWSVAGRTRLATLELARGDYGPELALVSFSPDGKSLAVLANEYTRAGDDTYRVHRRIHLVRIVGKPAVEVKR